MRLRLLGYISLSLLILGFIYFLFIVPVFFLTLSESRNSSFYETITVSVPKEARIGEDIEVIVYYFPRFFKQNGLDQIIFYDSSGAYNYMESLTLNKISSGKRVYPYTLGIFPFYKSFDYKIPQHVCPEDLVYESCKIVPTKNGKGKMTVVHAPILSTFFGEEGYQGDGEKIEVPINIIDQ